MTKTIDGNKLQKQTTTNYDDQPYQSFPYLQSRLDLLQSNATLFGLKPAKAEKSRVLELGCADGLNIISQAAYYPNSEFIGIDFSKKQIETGNEHIKKLGLKNITLKALSIEDINEDFGKFDYIISHGVFSWVPPHIQEKIFSICSKNLNKEGVAYISYNVLPGWNMIKTIRDMMLYHSKDFNNDIEKVQQSRLLLEFIKDSLEKDNSPYSNMLRTEAEALAKHQDSYILHEHLEENNEPIYFSEFTKRAAKHNLTYLSDASLASMYVGNMPVKAVEKLSEIKDIVRSEQYMDFITNRRFRTSLICHNTDKINRKVDTSAIEQFSVTMDIVPGENFKEEMIHNNENVAFNLRKNSDVNVGSTSPELKAIFYTLSQNASYPMSIDNLVLKANKYFKDNRISSLKKEFLSNAVALLVKGFLEISLLERDGDKVDLSKPKISTFSRFLINDVNANWLTSIRHNIVKINNFDKMLAKYFDGKHTQEEIISKVIVDMNNTNLKLNKDGAEISDAAEVKQHIQEYLVKILDVLKIGGILETPSGL